MLQVPRRHVPFIASAKVLGYGQQRRTSRREVPRKKLRTPGGLPMLDIISIPFEFLVGFIEGAYDVFTTVSGSVMGSVGSAIE